MKTPTDEKWLWAMRHGNNQLEEDIRVHGMWQSRSPLYPQGREEIEIVRATHLTDTEFAYLAHSPFVRARETAEIAVPNGSWEVLTGLAPLLEKELDDVYQALEPERHPQDLDQVEAFIPDFCEREGAHIQKTATEILNKIQLGQSALFVSHQPLLGILRGLLDTSFPPRKQTLPKAGIYRFRFDGNNQLLGVDTLLPPK